MLQVGDERPPAHATPPREGQEAGEGGVISIETGFGCNAYCAFCPQIRYRNDPDPDVPLDLETEDIRERIRHGADNGYRQIGFSGGEVTIRKDLLELVSYAKSFGYERIAITTNGMMLGYPRYAAALVQAGVTNVNVSVFGHEAALHDALMRTPGAFDMAMKGIDNLRNIAERTGRRIDMMSMCIAARQVIDHFPEHVELMGAKGIKLHMLQPFLMTKGNTQSARSYMSSWDRIEWAVREGAKVARRHGGHIKLFNTPVCSFWDIEADLERQRQKLDVFREHASHSTDPAQRSTTPGYYRVEACATCDEPCPGFRAEYYPQDRMVEEACASIDDHFARYGRGELWLGGLELMTEESMQAVVQYAKTRAERLVLMTAGIGRAYYEQFGRAVVRLVDEICFVLHPPRRDPRGFGDRHTSHGNLADVARGVEGVRRLGLGTPLSAMFTAEQLEEYPELPGELEAWGIRKVGVFAWPEGTGSRPWWDYPHRFRQVATLADLDVDIVVVGRGSGPRPDIPTVDPEPLFVRHRWTGRDSEWINWSVPWWAHHDQMLGGGSSRRGLPVLGHAPPARSADGS